MTVFLIVVSAISFLFFVFSAYTRLPNDLFTEEQVKRVKNSRIKLLIVAVINVAFSYLNYLAWEALWDVIWVVFILLTLIGSYFVEVFIYLVIPSEKSIQIEKEMRDVLEKKKRDKAEHNLENYDRGQRDMAKYTVILNSCGDNEQKVIEQISNIVGVDIEAVKAKVSSLPCKLCVSENQEKVNCLINAITSVGGNVDVEYSGVYAKSESFPKQNNKQEKKVCINCGSEIDGEHQLCPNCSYNFSTGEYHKKFIKNKQSPYSANTSQPTRCQNGFKAIKCEMCNSNDIVKQDGFYVCQHCGTKYTLEEAKKLMVTVDNSKKTNNLLELAKRAKEAGDTKKAASYYEQVLIEQPNNWEAYFYSTFLSAMETTIAGIENAAFIISNCVSHTMKIMSKNEISQGTECVAIALEVSQAAATLFTATMSHYREFNTIHASFAMLSENKQEKNARSMAIMNMLFSSGDHIEDYLSSIGASSKMNESSSYQLWKLGIDVYKSADLPNIPEVEQYRNKLLTKDPTYTTQTQDDGCYIATCVYGSYDCPEVWTLRRFRDDILAKCRSGRLFIKTYYKYSPKLVEKHGETKWFIMFWRNSLDILIRVLNACGVKNTYYVD